MKWRRRDRYWLWYDQTVTGHTVPAAVARLERFGRGQRWAATQLAAALWGQP